MTQNKALYMLEKALGDFFDDNMRRAVLVVGNGFHNHLERSTPRTKKTAVPGWEDLIKMVSNGVKISHHHGNPDLTAAWETAIIRALQANGKNRRYSAHEQERKLLQQVCSILSRNQYEESSPLNDLTARLFRRHRDILTLNFDRSIDRAISPQLGKLHLGRRCVSRVGPEGRATLHVRLSQQRVWYPHGIAHSRATSTSIQLGLRAYAQSAQLVNQSVLSYRKKQRLWLASHGKSVPRSWTSEEARQWETYVRSLNYPTHQSWVDMCMASPLVFLGCGLQRSELDLWILLHERQRQLARVQKKYRPNAFFLYAEQALHRSSNPDLGYIMKFRPAGIIPVGFNKYADIWNFLIAQP